MNKCKPTAKDWLDLLLLTLYLSGGKVKGKTRLQKLAFLVLQELKRNADKLPRSLKRLACLEFQPANFGPYARELTTDAVVLGESFNMLLTKRSVDKPVEYSLESRGFMKADSLERRLKAIGVDINGKFKELAQLPLKTLLRKVYEEFPEYTIKSKIASHLATGAVITWGVLGEGDIELINDLIKEGTIKMKGVINIDYNQDKEIILADGRVRIKWNFQDKVPRLDVSIYPKGSVERSNRM